MSETDAMHLSLGPYRYHLRRTDQKLFVNRKPVLAICDHQARELVIQEGIGPETLRQVIGDAVARIWQYRFGHTTLAAITATAHGAADDENRPDPHHRGGDRPRW